MQIELSKYHGHGNDFLILIAEAVPESEWSRFVRKVCDRHFGVGADGCVFVAGYHNPYSIRIFNRDGSEAGMSGNGSRCAAAFLAHRKGEASEIVCDTRSGRKKLTLLEEKDGCWVFRSSLGEPGFSPSDVPFDSDRSEIRDFPLEINGETLRIHALSMGNPQTAVFCDSPPTDEEFQRWGSAIEVHEAFPDRTNVSFISMESQNKLRIRIWERGVGPTLSSGTGSCGAAVAAIRAGLATSPVQVETESGCQEVIWTGGEVELIGSACYIAQIRYRWH